MKNHIFILIIIAVFMIGATNVHSKLSSNNEPSMNNIMLSNPYRNLGSINDINTPSLEEEKTILPHTNQGLSGPYSSVGLSKLTVSVDLSHVPSDNSGWYHNQIDNLQGNLTALGANFNRITSSFSIPVGTNVLLLPNSDVDFTSGELVTLSNWYKEAGPKLLWVTGDSDFNDFYSADASSLILSQIGSKLRMSSDTIEDADNNDGALYRVVAQTPVKDAQISKIVTDNVLSVVMHGPTSVLGYQNNAIVDLRTTSISGVEILMKSGPTAYAINNQSSPAEFDYYSQSNQNGSYPMVALENMGNDKYTLVSGETIFSDYKKMYDLVTEAGNWNSGNQDGKHLVDNIINWFNDYHLFPHNLIHVENNAQFLSQGFVGLGTQEDPYVIEGINITASGLDLVSIGSTTAYFVIRNSVFVGNNTENFGILLFDVQNGLIENNTILDISYGMSLENSNTNTVKGNIIPNGGGIGVGGSTGSHFNSILNNIIQYAVTGIYVDGSLGNQIVGNTITNSQQEGIYLQISEKTTIIGNEIYDNLGNGAGYDGVSNNNTFAENIVYNNDGFGILLGGSDNLVTHNDFHNNFPSGIPGTTQAADTGINNEVVENYWSDLDSASIYVIWDSANNRDLSPLTNPNHMIPFQDVKTLADITEDGLVSGLINMTWDMPIDNLGHTFSYEVHYSVDGGSSWKLVKDNITALSYSIDSNVIADGLNAIFKLEAVDEKGFRLSYITPDSYIIANVPHEHSELIITSFSPGDTVSGQITISWMPVIDSWGEAVMYNILYVNGSGNVDSNWIKLVGELDGTTYVWDTTNFSNGEYTIGIEANSANLSSFAFLQGVIKVNNDVSTQTDSQSDGGFLSTLSLPLILNSILISILISRKRSKFR